MVGEVRRVSAGDGARLREVRLAALAEAPGAFWQTWEAEAARPDDDWRRRAARNAAGHAHATFLLEHDGEPVGMVDVHQPSLVPEFRELAAMWVAPAMRATGAADLLVSAAVAWARSVGAIGVRLWVEIRNVPAQRMYRRHGFTQVGSPSPDRENPGGKVYLLMVLAVDPDASASRAFLARANGPWTDESG
ncbi:GNAT family N-acetyltransferase [Frankia sp. CNm7]|uniref:GNAT family N-acetyltransferase n=1 Tax=Frankia nepalensis TaxID=1836974 RepID=A0A937RM46_9ACTN|nr:GNAT family N-acetyltransferase [Frankia nepalensis]MBL7498888.1 GNAT family N-acetyltransferase [Frankia nepalensis]MBL7512563.1 GNAT family N-acetyltransferase [Frankia nepalensis]MBL7524251.1 GNAT family N-acetyltransferase [Frankia nepalensis]MBL7632922.1 GNAT family N-acetyltransferase [Frankia nepalensis]